MARIAIALIAPNPLGMMPPGFSRLMVRPARMVTAAMRPGRSRHERRSEYQKPCKSAHRATIDRNLWNEKPPHNKKPQAAKPGVFHINCLTA
jgi:hypothetical protein